MIVGIDHERPQAPRISSHPQDIKIQKGYRGMLEVTADGTMPLYYQWYYEDDVIPGMLIIFVHAPKHLATLQVKTNHSILLLLSLKGMQVSITVK